jgi:hypothetical protein
VQDPKSPLSLPTTKSDDDFHPDLFKNTHAALPGQAKTTATVKKAGGNDYSADDAKPALSKNTPAASSSLPGQAKTTANGKKSAGNDYSDDERDYALVKRTRRKKILKTKDNVKESHGNLHFIFIYLFIFSFYIVKQYQLTKSL